MDLKVTRQVYRNLMKVTTQKYTSIMKSLR